MKNLDARTGDVLGQPALHCESELPVGRPEVHPIHRISSACGRSFLCFVFDPASKHSPKTKHTKLLPQVDERQCSLGAKTNSKYAAQVRILGSILPM